MRPRQFSTALRLPSVPLFDKNKYPEIWQDLLQVHLALQELQGSLDLYTGAISADTSSWAVSSPSIYNRVDKIARVYLPVSEDIAYKDVVQIYDVAGVSTVRKANATDDTKPCRAFCTVSAGVLAGAYGEFSLLGILPALALTPGSTYYLDTTSGLYTSTAPAIPGNIVQEIGFALDATHLWFNPSLNPFVV